MNRHDSGFSIFSRTALSVAVAIVAAAPAMAQNTTAAIGGRVLTAEGKPVAGASVTILHRESGSVNNLVTDNEGRYSTRGLRVGGPYTVTVSKGAEKDVRNDIYLQLAESLSLDITLGANVLSTVVVTGTNSAGLKINNGNMGANTAVSRKELDAYASIARSLQDYARIDPRLAQTDKERGEISALGQNARFNTITIDGVRTNDTFGLEGNNLPTIKQPISIDAIEAVQVNLSNFDVTQQGYTGANINAVTKSGTNEIKGSVYYVYRDDKLSGKRFNRTDESYYDAPAFKEDTKGFTLGGPIIKDKLFFFASYEDFKSTRAAPTFGPVGSAMTNVGITPAQIAAAQAVAKGYGIDIGNSEATGTEVTVKDYLLKLDWNINSQHRANLRIAKTEQAEPTYCEPAHGLGGIWEGPGKGGKAREGQKNQGLSRIRGEVKRNTSPPIGLTQHFGTDAVTVARFKPAPKPQRIAMNGDLQRVCHLRTVAAEVLRRSVAVLDAQGVWLPMKRPNQQKTEPLRQLWRVATVQVPRATS
ncbi:hypothetical protein DBR47_00880 [Paucibacter sp. KBW04]|uniref:TonB-dependent receptor n=1 Tax=Paucibacter sp. KBW04 TaxID=2153361 RepID=UPI000F5705FE|nr:TonB-dependent receptor [Paucibacter sp. KBW04]RQO63160.1 hypothetical protein DBR47_00880 [Paucibacter sp. KBW04]